MIVVATDYATRWVEAKALTNGKANTVADFILERIITKHGSPKTLLSDRGATFRSDLVQELLKIMGVVNSFTTSYHPQCNGLTERFNHTLADMLSIYTNTEQTDWCQYISHVTFAYNTAKQETTKYSPFMLVYGREPVLPTEANLMEDITTSDAIEIREKALFVRNKAVENIQNKQVMDKTRYDNSHRYVEFLPGDQIKVFTPTRKIGRSEKLLLRWYGPYTVIEKQSDVVYRVRMGGHKNSRIDTIHVSRILPYNDPWTSNVQKNGSINEV